jgi:hypothetical protein
MAPQPGGASLPPSSASAPTGTADVGKASAMFMSAMQESGLDPVAVQGHGAVIADAVNKKYPGLGVTVDPKTDAVVWPGSVALDVTIPTAARAAGRSEALGGAMGASSAAAPQPTSTPFTVMPGSTAPDLSSLYTRTAPLSAMRS